MSGADRQQQRKRDVGENPSQRRRHLSFNVTVQMTSTTAGGF